MKRDSEALKTRTKAFALRVLRLYRSLPRTEEARILGTQLLRSSTSIGANYRAACRGRSRAEFVAKLGIVLEEADETVFWLELFQEGNVFPAEKLNDLVQEANELVSIFVSSVRTARGLPLQSDL
jgi:four helix bundle protein